MFGDNDRKEDWQCGASPTLRDSPVELRRLIFPKAESLRSCRRRSFGEVQAGGKQGHLATVEWRPDC
jgi:hypothetical protein